MSGDSWISCLDVLHSFTVWSLLKWRRMSQRFHVISFRLASLLGSSSGDISDNKTLLIYKARNSQACDINKKKTAAPDVITQTHSYESSAGRNQVSTEDGGAVTNMRGKGSGGGWDLRDSIKMGIDHRHTRGNTQPKKVCDLQGQLNQSQAPEASSSAWRSNWKLAKRTDKKKTYTHVDARLPLPRWQWINTKCVVFAVMNWKEEHQLVMKCNIKSDVRQEDRWHWHNMRTERIPDSSNFKGDTFEIGKMYLEALRLIILQVLINVFCIFASYTAFISDPVSKPSANTGSGVLFYSAV